MTKEKQIALEIGSIYMKSLFDFQDYIITRNNILREALVPDEILKKLHKQSNLIDKGYREFWNILRTKNTIYALDQAYYLKEELEDANGEIEGYINEANLNQKERSVFNGENYEVVTGDFEKDKDWVSINNSILIVFSDLRQKLKIQLKDIDHRIKKLEGKEKL